MRPPAAGFRFPAPAGRSAFTLLELLVAVAVIGVLAALVLAAAGRGRERANRVTCTGNLRAVHGALSRFAQENDGAVPVGYRLGKKNFNTTLYSGSSDKWVLLGRLLHAGIVTEPRVLFCPSERDPAQAFATEQNPWPRQQGRNLQGGYASAPVVDWASAEEPPTWPRMHALGHTALLADGAGMPARVDSRHRDGVNVVFTDGSARWVPRGQFEEQLRKSTAGGANDAQTAIWEIYSGTRTPDDARK